MLKPLVVVADEEDLKGELKALEGFGVMQSYS